MCILPNELIIQIYEHLDYNEIIKSLHIFPFLNCVVLLKLKKLDILKKSLLWENACKKNDIDILKFFHNNKIIDRYLMIYKAIDIASENGHIEIVQWLHTNNLYSIISYDTLMNSAKKGHLDVVRYIYDAWKIVYHSNNSVSFASWYGNKNILHYLKN